MYTHPHKQTCIHETRIDIIKLVHNHAAAISKHPLPKHTHTNKHADATIHRHTHTLMPTHTDRHTDTHTHTHTHTHTPHTDRHTDTPREYEEPNEYMLPNI